VVACLGLAVDLCSTASTNEMEAILRMNEGPQLSADAIRAYLYGKLDYLATSRPTAVNLFNAIAELKGRLSTAVEAGTMKEGSAEDGTSLDMPPPLTNADYIKGIQGAVKAFAEFAYERDRNDCRTLGALGAQALLIDAAAIDSAKKDDDPSTATEANPEPSSDAVSSTPSSSFSNRKLVVMTICNTGSLATSEYGTALGVIRALHEQGSLQGCIALETRPYNQGSRLTAYEMVVDQLPNATLICDSMAAAYLNTHSVDAVVVGADRICANGDVANKIGTYGLALLARHHRVPFYVAAPITTIDLQAPSGSYIEIEQRPASEVIESSRAPADIQVWNPAFDVTPANYIAGIITEKGVVRPDNQGTLNVEKFVWKDNQQDRTVSSRSGSFDTDTDEEDIIGVTADRQARRTIRAARRLSRLSLLVSKNLDSTPATVAAVTGRRGSIVPSNYREQTVETLPIYLSNHVPRVMKDVLVADRATDLTCIEFGDGNLNLVFLVTNSTNGKQVIAKQALPYVRCVGESWPMTFERAFFEKEALKVQKQSCPQHTPTVYYFSKSQGLIVMEYLAPPCQILRKGLISRVKFPTVAEDMGVFCAHTLFKTSGFGLSAHELRQAVEFWSQNRDMCQLTESVVFTEPYITHPNNRWTSPQLDADKAVIETDVELKLKAAEWKSRFVTKTSALVHGDLHSGSVMCAPEDHRTYAIDPEFAFYGPMGFDTGAFVANLFLNYVSQTEDGDYGEWVLNQVKVFWETFTSEFCKLWNDPATHTGFLVARETFGDINDSLSPWAHHQSQFLLDLLVETLGFAGMKMLRRVVGIAHVEDLEAIEDVAVKVKCERHALEVAKVFIKSASSISTIDEAIQIARSKKT
jgi:5-methylthioribose kinase